MPNIPTPFVGGADRPNVDRSRGEDLAPPFSPDAEDEAPEIAVEPAEDGDEAVMELETADSELVAEARPEAEEMADEPTAEATVEEVLPSEEAEAPSIAEDEAISMPELEPEAVAESPVSVETTPMTAGDEFELPDFLLGPDGEGGRDELPADSIDVGEAETKASEPPDTIDEKARELLAGDTGERIRALISDLGLEGAEDAIARAYAAGYLARIREEE